MLVREIRSALGDDAQQPRFVRSEAGRGYAFVADTASPSRSPSDAAAEAPLFLCRNAQLRAFGEAFDAVRAGSSRVLLVSGERGAGKSALCDAFLRSAGVATVLRVGTGQCPDAPAEDLLEPLLDALANLAQQYRSLVPRVLAEEAPAWFARFPEWAEEPTPAAADTDALVEQLTRALAILSKDAVTILVLEDLQWADRATLQILARLAGRSWPARWLVVATACPYSLTPEGPILDSLADAMRAADPALVVDVGSFACDQIERYLDARFGAGCLTDLAPALHELTAGNPLLFVTLADGLVARAGAGRPDGLAPERPVRRPGIAPRPCAEERDGCGSTGSAPPSGRFSSPPPRSGSSSPPRRRRWHPAWRARMPPGCSTGWLAGA